MVVITIVRWGYKPTYNVWGSHIVGEFYGLCMFMVEITIWLMDVNGGYKLHIRICRGDNMGFNMMASSTAVHDLCYTAMGMGYGIFHGRPAWLVSLRFVG